MKKIIAAAALLLASSMALAQGVPQRINYQAVAIDADGDPIPGYDMVGRPIDNAEMDMRLTVLDGSPSGAERFKETHTVRTDAYGLFTLEIGGGTLISGDFATINWADSDRFLRVEMDRFRNGNWTLLGVQKMLTVPYSFIAERALNADFADQAQQAVQSTFARFSDTAFFAATSATANHALSADTSTWAINVINNNDNDADSTNELQALSRSNDTIYLSQGGFVVLPTDLVDDADNNPTNELQNLSIAGDTVFLSQGGFIKLPVDQINDADHDSTNEFQVLSFSNDTLFISNGNKVYVGLNQKASKIDDLTDGVNKNLSVGLADSSLFQLTTGQRNSSVGHNSLQSVVNGSDNSALGFKALKSNIGGQGNSAFGANALTRSTASFNSAFGFNALSNNTVGSSLVALGAGALQANTIGQANSVIGRNAMFSNTSGSHNSSLGANSLSNNTTGNLNTAVGSSSLANNSIGYGNVAIGVNALANNNEGSLNVAIGAYALEQNISNPGSLGGKGFQNVAVGANALRNATSVSNVAVGAESMMMVTRGSQNTGLGEHTMRGLRSGNSNVAIGYSAMIDVDTSISNNVVIGRGAGSNMKGSNNIFLGHSSGTQTTGSGNIFIGIDVANNITHRNLSQKLIIHNGNSLSPLIYGDFSTMNLRVNGTFLTDNIGIGVASPARTLHVKDVMRLEPLTSAPSNPAKGDMYFDGTLNKLRVFDGSTWQSCW
jgi:hypothetical protein